MRFARVVCLAAFAAGLSGCSAGRSPLPSIQMQTSSARGLASGRVTRLLSQPPVAVQMAWLMTDGSILAQSQLTRQNFYRYSPDAKGDYAKGKWREVGSLQAGYAPLAFASSLLADGRFVISGGEYNSGGKYTLQLVNLGAVYDPVKMTWTALGHPHGWGWIGDSPSSILPDGRFLLGDKLHEWDAYLDPKTLQWTSVGDAGKVDFNAEEGWTLLADGTILTADVKDAPNSEIYDPATRHWKSAGTTVVDLHSPTSDRDCVKYGPKPKDCYSAPGEIGPAILRPDGTVFYTGSFSGPQGNGAGHTAIYYSRGPKAGKWVAGPDFPNGDNAGDSFAVLEPSGNVLVFGDSGALYEWNGKTFTQVRNAWAVGPPILLPTGQIMMPAASTVVLYNPPGSPNPSWAPAIKNYPKSVAPGKTYKITGERFNGLSQAMAYGDEEQNPTNYPLVRITTAANGNVYYARTHDHSSMGVATGAKLVWTYFDVPKTISTGAARLEVVANGIASKPVKIVVSTARL
ncbi:MAG: hypothetical protein WB681_01620 [Candidatus Cybelea sp.]